MRIIEKANLDKETLTSVIQQKNLELKDAETIINANEDFSREKLWEYINEQNDVWKFQ